MASALDSADFVQNHAITVYDHDPDASTAVNVAVVDMRDYEEIVCIAIRTIGTGAVDGLKLYSYTNPTGDAGQVEIKTTTANPDAMIDYVILSARADELGGGRYVSLNIELATDTDEFVVVYIRTKARFPRRALSGSVVA